jgi:hypothetical protein
LMREQETNNLSLGKPSAWSALPTMEVIRHARVYPKSSIPGRAFQIARCQKAVSFDHFVYPMLTIKLGHD